MRWWWCGTVLVLACCGRVNFDPVALAMPSDGGSADGALALPVLVQSASQTMASTVSITIPIAPTQSGDLLIVATGAFFNSQPITSMTDDAGNTYVSANALATSSVDLVEIWYVANSRAGATALTVTNASTATRQVWLLEVSGMDPTSPLDVVGTINNAAPTTSVAAPQINPTTSPSLVVSVANSMGNIVGLHAGSPFVAMPIYTGNDAAYYFTSAPGAYGPVWDAQMSGDYCASTVAFKPAP